MVGPVLFTRTDGTSVAVVKDLLEGKYYEKGCLPVAYGAVDVRDVARAHIAAAEKPEAIYQKSRMMKRKRRNMSGLYREYGELQDTKRVQDTLPSKYEYDANKCFSESYRGDKFGILHLQSSCYIANQISWHYDEKRPNGDKEKSMFLYPVLIFFDAVSVSFQKYFLKTHFARKEIYHGRGKENPKQRYSVYKRKIVWKKEYSNEYKRATWYECKSSEC